MFLHFFKSLYKKQPKLFYLFGSFFILQLFFIAIKLEVTPFFLYGMFSEKVQPVSTFSETEVWVDGQALYAIPLSYKEKMLLEENVKKYLSIQQNKGIDIVQTRVEQRYSFLTNSFTYAFLKERIFNQPDDLQKFETWLRGKCNRITKNKVKEVTIVMNTYLTDPTYSTIKKIKSEAVATF